MTTEERTQTMDSIAQAGDATCIQFATYCMRLIEETGEVTADDAHEFASKRGLL